MKILIRTFAIIILFTTTICFAMPRDHEQCYQNEINYLQATDFIADLITKLQSDDKKQIATMISYPLRVNKIKKNGKTKSFYIKTQDEFIEQYPNLFTQKLKMAINRDKSNIFCNYQGAMVANGSLWFNTFKNSMKIISIVRQN